MSQRSFKYHKFLSASTDLTIVIPLSGGGVAGTYAVYARRISGAGTATLAVDGSFRSGSSETDGIPAANDRVAVQTATSVGTGALTNILGTSEDDVFPYLVLALDRTGTCEVDVYIALM